MKREMGLSYDISSWSETERRNEILLKAGFIYIYKVYEDRYSS